MTLRRAAAGNLRRATGGKMDPEEREKIHKAVEAILAQNPKPSDYRHWMSEKDRELGLELAEKRKLGESFESGRSQ